MKKEISVNHFVKNSMLSFLIAGLPTRLSRRGSALMAVFFSRKFLACAAFLSCTLVCRADTTYYYTGPNFTQFYCDNNMPGICNTNPYSTADKITGSITVSAPLAPSSSYFYGTSSGVNLAVVGFSFTDGVDTITNLNEQPAANYDYIELFTDQTGAIYQWNLAFQTNEIPNHTNYSDQIFSESGVHDSGMNVTTYNSGTCCDEYQGQVDATGSFSLSPGGALAATPEPSSLALLGTGILAGLLRRRLA
jgi:hypothetical protein